MKKALSLFLCIAISLSVSFAVADVDISGLSYDELVELVNKAQMEMMKSDKWQEVLVPEGIYQVGKDIPAGHWTISAPPKGVTYVGYGTSLESDGSGLDNIINGASLTGIDTYSYDVGDTTQVSWELKEGQYVEIGTSSAVFTPFTGNSFSFK